MSESYYIFKTGNQFGSELQHIFESNYDDDIRKFIDKYNNYENAKIHLKPRVGRDTFTNYYIRSLAESIIYYQVKNSVNFMKILIDVYGFVPDEEFKTVMYCMTFEMFLLFCDYFELTKNIDVILHIFQNQCYLGNIDNIKHIISMGYNINEIDDHVIEYYKTAIYVSIKWNQYNIMEYLLDLGINYKKYEENIFQQCISNSNLKMLMLFINYGADISVLNNKKNMPDPTSVNIYNLLSSFDFDPLIIIGLIIKKNY